MQRPANSRVKHGDPTCADYGCKRDECLEARRKKQKRNKFLLQSGRPGMVNAGRAADHLTKFRKAGLRDSEIIQMVCIPRSTFYRVMRGEPLTRRSEQRILSVPVPPPTGEIRTLAAVDATGTHRRLKALMWLGWPPRVLEERLDVHADWTERSLTKRKRVTLVTEARVRSIYDEWWNLQPERAGVEPSSAESTRMYARSLGWDGPLAWDDDTIDDPNALPLTDAVAPVASEGGNLAARWLMGESVILEPEDRKEVLTHLFEWTNQTCEEIAARLEMTPAAAEQAWNRMKKKARADGRPVPWRRAYVPRERSLNQNEMEEAA